MILFLSSAFLRRLRIQWKPGLKGFLVGERNLFFFYPDSLVEASDITPATIDAFLEKIASEKFHLLGFLTPEELEFLPEYAEIITGNRNDPLQWKARLHTTGDQGPEYRELKIGSSAEGKSQGN